jgi:hypothetical protein
MCAFWGFFLRMCITIHDSKNLKLTTYSQILSRLRMSGVLPLLPLCTMYHIYLFQFGFHPMAVVNVLSPICEDNENMICLTIFRFYALNTFPVWR